ncbi:hypothetical protein [Parasphingorhabdus pacifica]
MTDRNSGRDEDIALLRNRLNQLVEDVDPPGDALPRLLSATRRRRLPRRRPLLAVGGAAVASTAAFLLALLVFPGEPNRGAEPVSVLPNSYVADSGGGVIASFDVVTGQRLEEIGRVSGVVTGPLAADAQRVFAVVSRGGQRELVEVSSSDSVAALGQEVPATGFAVGAGRVAYADGAAIVIAGGGAERRIPVPGGQRVVDMALDSSGRLAVLATDSTDSTSTDSTGEPGSSKSGRTAIHVVEPDAASANRQAIRTGGECGPVAIAWSDGEIATAQPVDCDSTRVRIATVDRESGAQVGAGVPFETGRLEADQVQLSTDRLGRFLLATSDTRQWLVDGADVVEAPSPCDAGDGCAAVPGSFWG